MKKPDLKCPRCDKSLDFLKQIREWVEFYMEDAQPPAFLNIWCDTCGDMTTSIYWEENDGREEVEAPALRDFTGGLDRVVLNFPTSRKDDPIARNPPGS